MRLPEWGQWIGGAKGTNNAGLLLNIDKDSPSFGAIYFRDNSNQLSSFRGSVNFEISENKLVGHVNNITVTISSGNTEEVVPTHARIDVIKQTGELLEGTWRASNGQGGTFDLVRRESTKPHVHAQTVSWEEFVQYAVTSKRNHPGLIFRGQPDSKLPLRTSFHRTTRRDLGRYALQDMKSLNDYLAVSSGIQYDLNNPNEFPALMSLAQHHGYPTPLLDWSKSPFIAAFFAFRSLRLEDSDGHVRVYAFDLDEWDAKGQGFRSTSIDEPRFSITPLDIISQGNSRVLPQQSLFTFSNINDMERWITVHESQRGDIISAFDIEKSSRRLAMHDLENMNISAASLFPGLDGSFEALKERAF